MTTPWDKLSKQLTNFIETMKDEWDIELDDEGNLVFDYQAFWHDFRIIIELTEKIKTDGDKLQEKTEWQQTQNRTQWFNLCIANEKLVKIRGIIDENIKHEDTNHIATYNKILGVLGDE